MFLHYNEVTSSTQTNLFICSEIVSRPFAFHYRHLFSLFSAQLHQANQN